MTDVDRQIARTSELLDRTRERALAQRKRARAGVSVAKRLALIAGADAAIIIATIIIGWNMPIGMGGALFVAALMMIVSALILFIRVGAPVAPEKLMEVPLKALPARTEQWLETQRPALPAPAQTLLDGIGLRLDTLGRQLADLDEAQPAAVEVRKLIGEQLPELIRGYTRVPEPLRRTERNGKTPDAQLADSLRLIDSEIGEMTEQLAQGDLDRLATRGRFLEIKYQGGDGHA